jgi:integrase
MPLLYYWRNDNYFRDLDLGAGYHLNQSNPLLHQIEIGDSLWAFTRAKNGDYVLAADLVIKAKTINPPNFRYGRYRVWGDLKNSRYFKVDNQPRREDESNIDFRRRIVVGQVFQMALLTGARVGEIIALRWSQIDFDAKILQIIGTKTRFKSAKVVRYLEVTSSIEAILRDRETFRSGNPIRRGTVCEFVFSKTGNSVTKYHQILRAAAKATGVTYGADIRGGFITHDARHTAVTRILQAGIDLSTVGAITGHTDANLILHYSHATRESRKKATSVLENFVTDSQKKAG